MISAQASRKRWVDRQETLDVQVGANPVQPLVTASSYLPCGPLKSLALGNGATESRDFDGRYVPEAIVLGAPTPRRWSYTTDGVGNILEIEGLIGCSEADLVLSNQSVTGIETFSTCAGIEAGPAFSVETGAERHFHRRDPDRLGRRLWSQERRELRRVGSSANSSNRRGTAASIMSRTRSNPCSPP